MSTISLFNMRQYLTIILIILILPFGARAQSTLNIHQKNDVLVCLSFSEQPVVTYIETGIHVKTMKLEVDIPYDNLMKFSFVDGLTSNDYVRWEGSEQEVRIYTLDGKLVKTITAAQNVANLNLTNLPAGNYVVTQDNKSYKITIQK